MHPIVSHLSQSDIFYQFTPQQLEWVAGICREASFEEGDLIFKESSRSKELYVILQGEVDILVPRAGTAKGDRKDAVKSRLVRGQSFGEIALVDEGVRSASARAAQKDTRLLVIPRERLMMLCDSYPHLGYRLMYNLAADLAMKMRDRDFRSPD